MSEINLIQHWYTIPVCAASTGVPDATAMYFASAPSSATSVDGAFRAYVPKAGTVVAVYLVFTQSVIGSAETTSAHLRLNAASNTTLVSGQALFNATTKTFNATGLSLAVTEGDYLQIQIDGQTYATNPTSIAQGIILVRV